MCWGKMPKFGLWRHGFVHLGLSWKAILLLATDWRRLKSNLSCSRSCLQRCFLCSIIPVLLSMYGLRDVTPRNIISSLLELDGPQLNTPSPLSVVHALRMAHIRKTLNGECTLCFVHDVRRVPVLFFNLKEGS